jgi:hypothetical protein
MQNFVSPLPDLVIANGATGSNKVVLTDARSIAIGAPAFLGTVKVQVAQSSGGTMRNLIVSATGLALVSNGVVHFADPAFKQIRVLSLAAQTAAKNFTLTKSFQA